jgi:hypothetical protein
LKLKLTFSGGWWTTTYGKSCLHHQFGDAGQTPNQRAFSETPLKKHLATC